MSHPEAPPHHVHTLPGMSERQYRLACLLDIPTFVMVLLTIPALLLHFSEFGGWVGSLSHVLNWTIYGWFVFEALVMLALSPGLKTYIVHSKLDLFVLATTMPILPPPFQALWVLRMLRFIDVLPVLLGRFGSITLLPYAIILSFIAVFGGGMAFSHFEGITIFDGMYWANTTVNTVGYGDVSAHTQGGKLLSMVLQWTGNVILALLIGSVAATVQQIILGRWNKEDKDGPEEDLQA